MTNQRHYSKQSKYWQYIIVVSRYYAYKRKYKKEFRHGFYGGRNFVADNFKIQ